MFNSLFQLLFKLLDRVAKLSKFPAQLHSTLITLIVMAIIQLVMFVAALTGIIAIWYALR
jgi:hypothetical protein